MIYLGFYDIEVSRALIHKAECSLLQDFFVLIHKSHDGITLHCKMDFNISLFIDLEEGTTNVLFYGDPFMSFYLLCSHREGVSCSLTFVVMEVNERKN